MGSRTLAISLVVLAACLAVGAMAGPASGAVATDDTTGTTHEAGRMLLGQQAAQAAQGKKKTYKKGGYGYSYGYYGLRKLAGLEADQQRLQPGDVLTDDAHGDAGRALLGQQAAQGKKKTYKKGGYGYSYGYYGLRKLAGLEADQQQLLSAADAVGEAGRALLGQQAAQGKKRRYKKGGYYYYYG